MKIDFDSLVDPIFLFIYWLVAGTLWVIIPLPPQAPPQAKVEPTPKVVKKTGPPPEVVAAFDDLRSRLESLNFVLEGTRSSASELERQIQDLSSEKSRLEAQIEARQDEMKSLTGEKSRLEQVGQANEEQRRQTEARMAAEIARQMADLEAQLRLSQQREAKLRTEMAAEGTSEALYRQVHSKLAPRAVSPQKIPYLVELYKNHVIPVTAQFFDIKGGGLLARGPRSATRKSLGESIEEMSLKDSAFTKFLDRLKPEKHYVSFLLNQDSLAAFRAARNYAYEKGFEVGWLPTDTREGRLTLYSVKYYKELPEDETLPKVAPILK